jgi:hypothetical protein
LWPLWLLIGLVAALYLPYAVFEAWWYIRFLLPAFPAALVLVAITVTGAASRLPSRVRPLAIAAATVVLVALSVTRARALHTLDLARDERRYAQMAEVLEQRVPVRSAFVCMQHSGSVHHYLARPILRWELLAPGALDGALAHLQQRGYTPYLLLDAWEEARFRERFARASPIGQLDWPPRLELRSPTPIRLYDPFDRSSYMAGATIRTELVFPPRR